MEEIIIDPILKRGIESMGYKEWTPIQKEVIPLLKEGIMCGVIYTQINDCEKGGNGIYTFDREVLKLDKEMIKSINDIINKI